MNQCGKQKSKQQTGNVVLVSELELATIAGVCWEGQARSSEGPSLVLVDTETNSRTNGQSNMAASQLAAAAAPDTATQKNIQKGFSIKNRNL